MILVDGYGLPTPYSGIVPSSPMPSSQAGEAPSNVVVPLNPPPKSVVVKVCGGSTVAQSVGGGPSVLVTAGGRLGVAVGRAVGVGGTLTSEQPARKTTASAEALIAATCVRCVEMRIASSYLKNSLQTL